MKGFIDIGPMIRKRRIALGYGQREFSRLVGEHESNWNAIEKGRRRVSLLMIEKIAGALKIETEVLFLVWARRRYPQLLSPETLAHVVDLEKEFG